MQGKADRLQEGGVQAAAVLDDLDRGVVIRESGGDLGH